MKVRETQYPPEIPVPLPNLTAGWQQVQKLLGGRVGKEGRREDAETDTPKHKGTAITYASLTLKKKV